MIPYPSDRMILLSEYDRGYANGQKDAETHICPFYEIDDDGHGICKNDRYTDKIARFKDITEQRQVVELMNELLIPTLNYLNADTAIAVRRALYLLGEIGVEKNEQKPKSDCCTCANANNPVVCSINIKDLAEKEGCDSWHSKKAESEPQAEKE